MIIPRYRICDICGKKVGINRRYFIIKSKNILNDYAGSFHDNKNYDIRVDCMQEFATYLHTKLKGEEK